MSYRIARIDTSFTNKAGHHPIQNVEIWPEVPTDVGNFTFRQIGQFNPGLGPIIDRTGATIMVPGSYVYPVDGSCSVNLSPSGDVYYDMHGTELPLVFMPD